MRRVRLTSLKPAFVVVNWKYNSKIWNINSDTQPTHAYGFICNLYNAMKLQPYDKYKVYNTYKVYTVTSVEAVSDP